MATGYILTEALAVTASRPAWQASFELALIVATTLLAATLARDVLRASLEFEGFWILPIALLLGVLSADFATGAVHWFCDSFFAADTPVVGRALVAPFREHHVDPQGITRHGLLELHGNSCIPLIMLLLAARALLSAEAAPGLLVHSSLLFFTVATMATNQCHRWAHEISPGPAVRWFQRAGLILSPEMHARHHRGEFRQSYCMTTGWMNPLLDRLRFFPRLEQGIRALNPSRH